MSPRGDSLDDIERNVDGREDRNQSYCKDEGPDMTVFLLKQEVAIVNRIIDEAVGPAHALLVEYFKVGWRIGIDMRARRIDHLVAMSLQAQSHLDILSLM